MKKLLAGLLAASMMATAFAGCGGSSASSKSEGSKASSSKSESSKNESDTEEKETNALTGTSGGFEGRDDISYVMIYNPAVCSDEDAEKASQQKSMLSSTSTGDFSAYVDPGMSRADDLGEEPVLDSVTPNLDIPFDVDLSGDRGAFIPPTYKVGDKHEFFFNGSTGKTEKDTFTCIAVGDHSYVWTCNSEKPNETVLEAITKEFDEKIYDADVAAFGEPRYADVGGKISILVHKMSNSCLRGYFEPAELLNISDGVTELDATRAGLTINHATIHVNTDVLISGEERMVCATLAHEFQHLINFGSFFESGSKATMATWLNESMSAYAEENMYPGVKVEKGMIYSIAHSAMVRGGQSLYNFATKDKPQDIGSYASVYLFAMYLANLAGENVFHDVQDAFRNSFGTAINTATGLYKGTPSDIVSEISDKYTYPSEFSFASKEEEFMSKLTLDYYLSLMSYSAGDPKAFADVAKESLLYDEINPASIEEGGRVFVATKNGTYTIPSDAGKPLAYIGFDKDFKPVTDVIYQ